MNVYAHEEKIIIEVGMKGSLAGEIYLTNYEPVQVVFINCAINELKLVRCKSLKMH